MGRDKKLLWVFLFVLIISLLGCGMTSLMPGSIGGTPALPTLVPGEQPTPSSPLAGDWGTATEFGTVIFRIDPTGSAVTTVLMALNGWHCGGTTLTTQMTVTSTWPVEGDEFLVHVDLNPPHIEYIEFDGVWDKKAQSFSGTWEGDAYGSHCNGRWSASTHS